MEPGHYAYYVWKGASPGQGLDGSDIAQLRVVDRDGGIIARYDERGWYEQQLPGTEGHAVVTAVLKFYTARTNAGPSEADQIKAEHEARASSEALEHGNDNSM